MADGRYGIASLEHGHEEVDGRRVGAEGVRVGHAARQDRGVVVGRVGPVRDRVDGEAVGAVEVPHGLDHPRSGSHELGRPAGVDHRLPGSQQLAFLDALVGHDEGDPHIL